MKTLTKEVVKDIKDGMKKSMTSAQIANNALWNAGASAALFVTKIILTDQISAIEDDYYKLYGMSVIQSIALQEYDRAFREADRYTIVPADKQRHLRNVAIIFMISANKARSIFIDYFSAFALTGKQKDIVNEWRNLYESKNYTMETRIKQWLNAECR